MQNIEKELKERNKQQSDHIQDLNSYIQKMRAMICAEDLSRIDENLKIPTLEQYPSSSFLNIAIESFELNFNDDLLNIDDFDTPSVNVKSFPEPITTSKEPYILDGYSNYESFSADNQDSPKQSKQEKDLPPIKDTDSNLSSLNYHVSIKYLKTIKIFSKGKETLAFYLSVYNKSNNQQLKRKANGRSEQLYPLPDKTLFQTFAPSKATLRSESVQKYLNQACIMFAQSKELLEFLASPTISYNESGPIQGFLYKRGKTLGNWKAKFYTINNGQLINSEFKNSEITGTIDLKYIKVSKFEPFEAVPTENDPCHAIVITEYKPAGSNDAKTNSSPNSSYVIDMKPSAKHILSCDNDEERDCWLKSLCQEILKFRPRDWATLKQLSIIEESVSPPGAADNKSNRGLSKRNVGEPSPRVGSLPSSPSRTRTVASPSGLSKPNLPPRGESNANSKSAQDQLKDDLKNLTPSSVTAFLDDQEKVQTQRLAPLLKDEIGEILDVAISGNPQSDRGKASIFAWNRKDSIQKSSKNRIFGVSLEDAISISRISLTYPLPAIVFRCIEYLEDKKVWKEEGIYRLSGSSAEVTSLKLRFEEELDVDLLKLDQYIDPHAIAGLLKLYFRELPATIFEKELKDKLSEINDLEMRHEKIVELEDVVSNLPKFNFIILRTLLAHLLRITKDSDKNKMTVRNLSIVFSPTLGIPANLFALMLSEFNSVFSKLVQSDIETYQFDIGFDNA